LRAVGECDGLLLACNGGVPHLGGTPAVDAPRLALDGPRRAVPRKLLSNPIVVKRSAPSGRFANVPCPQEVPASATSVAACR
jgi:hypothetical protein